MTIKVLIADDHTLFRQGLVGLLETREDLVRVIGEASSGRETIHLTEQLRPDVVLMDIYMPDKNGLEAAKEIRERFPDTKVVMLTSSESDEHLYRAVEVGASGYLLKNLDASQLFELLARAMKGEAAMTPEMASRLLKGIAKRSANQSKGEEALTTRELTVLRMLAVGHSNQEIADHLVISVHTVKTHIRSILDKLRLENRTQAANYAMDRGLVVPRVKDDREN